MLLAYGGGVYVQIAGTECMGRVHGLATSLSLRICCLAFFTLGAAGIGLVLLDHAHCTEGGGGHAH